MLSSFDRVIDRKGSGCFKYDAMKLIYGRDDLLAMWVADMDFAVSPQIQAALRHRAEHPVYGYNFKAPAFKESLDAWLMKRHGWNTTEHKLISLPSLMTALALAILSLTKEGDGILIQSPVYPPFHSQASDHRRKLLINPLVNEDGYYRIDWVDFELKAAQARMFVLCNPHNPVGRVFTPEELARMADTCRKHNLIIFSDEIHADLVYAPHRHIPIAALAEDITLTGISPAKSFNIAGMGTAVLISQNPELIKPVEKLNFALHTYMGNSMGIAAFTAAYGESEAWLNELLLYLKANRDFVLEEIPKALPMIKISPIEGTYLAWLDFRAYGLSEDQIMRVLRDDCRLALNEGSAFGEEGRGFMRLNFGCPRSVLEDTLVRLKHFPKE